MSSLQLLFSEDVDSNSLATAALPIKGNNVVPRWDVLMPQCSSEPMIIEVVPSPSHPGNYSHFACALFICSRSCSAYAWHLCHFGLPIHNHIVAHRLFAAKASLDKQKNSGPVDSAGSDSLLGSLELMMDKTSPPGKGDSLMVLHDLRRKRDDLSALDLSDRVKSMAARLRADREEQRHEAAKLKAIREMSQEELASILRRLEDQVDAQRRTCDRTHMDVLRTKYALGKAERAADQAYLQCQSAFAILYMLEGSVRLLRDGFPDVIGGSHDYHLIDVTEEEIQGRAKELIKRLHADKIRELDEQIASISWP